jgi:uncharacterized protein DUF5906
VQSPAISRAAPCFGPPAESRTMTPAARGEPQKSSKKSTERSTEGSAIPGRRAVPDSVFDQDPELHNEAEKLRAQYKQSQRAAPEADNTTGWAYGVSLGDFHAYMPMHSYMFTPTRQLWPAVSVNARISRIKLTDKNGDPVLDENGKQKTVSATAWLDRHKPVEQMTWAPGEPTIIRDKLILEGGWTARRGVNCFNLYHPPTIKAGDDATLAEPWLNHLAIVYPEEAEREHILDWLAHRVQRPHEKINHALVFGGGPGIGKDSILAPVRHAVGPWNVREASPSQILGRFNGFLKSVILRINEAHDLGEYDRFAFYQHMKSYIAAPPEVLPIDEKNLREYPIPNVCGVVITSNHKTDGLFLAADDRRHFVAWSNLTKEDYRFKDKYWSRLYAYYEDGGNEAVAAFLQQRNIDHFDPKAPPPQTAAFWAIIDNHRPSEESELADILDLMGRPHAFTLAMLIKTAEGQANPDGGFIDWLRERKNRRQIPHRLEKCGYVPVHNPDAEDGLWRIRNKRQAAYADKNLPLREQIKAAKELTNLGK